MCNMVGCGKLVEGEILLLGYDGVGTDHVTVTSCCNSSFALTDDCQLTLFCCADSSGSPRSREVRQVV